MDGSDRESFAVVLRRRRERAGLSQEGLAERAQLSVNAVSALERGTRRRPQQATLSQLADALGLTGTERGEFVAAARVPIDEPDPRALPGHSSLPIPPTALIGREQEEEAIAGLLQNERTRLLTLTGTGGVGKTRLALQVARSLRDTFRDGVTFVSLAPLSNADLVASALGQALGLREIGPRPLLDVLVSVLGQREQLIVLDNFEHVVEAAQLIARLVGECPRVRFLVTSRRPLQVRGEQEFAVAPLRLPPKGRRTLPEIALSPAVELFVDRARALSHEFQLTHENASDVAQICRRLDGLPLAIELAAARTRLPSLRVLRTRLDRRFQLLTGGPRDLPGRLQTLRATIDWSYDLLSDDERVLFRWLSAFGESFDLPAAVAVVSGESALGTEHPDYRPFEELVAHSLLQTWDVVGEPRFGMLESIREYGLERLAERGEEATVRRRHAEFYLTLAEAVPPEIWQPVPERLAALHKIEREQENVWLALRWVAASSDPVLGLRWGAALGWFWWRRAYANPAEPPPTSAVPPPALAGHALQGAAYVAWQRGDYVRADALMARGRAPVLSHGGHDPPDPEAEIDDARQALRLVARWERFDLAARSIYEEISRRRQAHGVPPRAGWPLVQNGWLAFFREDRSTAGRLFGEAATRLADLGDKLGVAAARFGQGWIAQDTGELEGAKAHYRASLELLQEETDARLVPYVLANCSTLALARGKEELAVTLVSAARAAWTETGVEVPPAIAVLLEGWIDRARQRIAPATFAAAWSRGTTLTRGELLVLAEA